MLDGYNIRDQKLPHFITATVVDWIDVLNLNNFTKYNEYRSSNAARSGDHRRAYSSINKLLRAEYTQSILNDIQAIYRDIIIK